MKRKPTKRITATRFDAVALRDLKYQADRIERSVSTYNDIADRMESASGRMVQAAIRVEESIGNASMDIDHAAGNVKSTLLDVIKSINRVTSKSPFK